MWKSGVIAAVIATLALLGAVTGVDALQDFGGARPMLPVGALAILIAAAGLVRRRGLGVPLVLGGAIALAGLLPTGQEIPVNAAVCVILIGVGLLCLSRHRNSADGCALVVALIAGLALLGYLFEVPELQRGLRSSPLTPMAVPTAFALLALSAGVLAARTEGGLMALWSSDGPGGGLVRRLAPAAVILPIVLAFLSLQGQLNDVFGMREGMALMGAALILIFGTLVVMNAGALERTRHRELAIIESTVDAVIILDARGRICEFNASAERMFGFACEEVMGRELGPLVVPPELRDAHRRGLRRAVQTGESSIIGHPVELPALRADGSEFPAEITISRLTGGGPAMFVGHVRDITERREGEAVARRLAALVESSADAIVAMRLDGLVESWNAGAERIYGYRREEAIGCHVGELILPPYRRPQLAAALEDLRRSGSLSLEVVHMRRDGSEFPVEATVSVMTDAAGAPAGMSLIARDITERHALEEQLRQAQKMEAIGQLAGGIAHDFNNLLTVIAGYGQLARARVGNGAGAAELSEIERAAERATVLTRQLLAFSRRQILDPIVLDLAEVVRGLTPMLERLIGEDIAVELRSDDTLPGVLADPGQIEQVVINLAVNARDAMPGGGHLLIETRTDGVFVRLSVTDTGVGIAPEALPHVFEPFYTTKPVGEGTGLGLASVHGAITQSGGNVRVRSALGQGTTIEISLPATSQRGRAGPAPVRSEPVGGSETILLCEDEEGVRALVEIVLSGAGYRVLGEARPTDAIARAAIEDIDALVTDVIMPDMPGPELARRLELPTLFVSGYTADTVHGRGSLPPGSAFLEKPFDSDTLLRTVRDLLDAR